jgi:hypothetical protein
VAEFFEKGGQQYLYAEDLLTLEQAKTKKIRRRGRRQQQQQLQNNDEETKVLVPPPEILYGVPLEPDLRKQQIENRESQWKRAHLMPLRVPKGHKELPTLEQGKEAVLEAVRGGFATAFDSLSSIVGLEHISGLEAAKLVFPAEDEVNTAKILARVMDVPGEEISGPALQQSITTETSLSGNVFHDFGVGYRCNDTFSFANVMQSGCQHPNSLAGANIIEENLSHQALLAILPGFRGGRFGHLARGLRSGATASTKKIRNH